MAGAGETKWPRLFVRSPAAARTPDFIEAASSFEIYHPRARDVQRFPRYSTNYDGGVAFFSDVPAVRRPTDNYTRTAAGLRRVLSCGARLARSKA